MGKIIPIVGDYAVKEIGEIRERIMSVLSAELNSELEKEDETDHGKL